MTSAGVPRLVVGKILNHAETGVTAVYDRNETASNTGQDGELRRALPRQRLSVVPAVDERWHGRVAIARVRGTVSLAPSREKWLPLAWRMQRSTSWRSTRFPRTADTAPFAGSPRDMKRAAAVLGSE